MDYPFIASNGVQLNQHGYKGEQASQDAVLALLYSFFTPVCGRRGTLWEGVNK